MSFSRELLQFHRKVQLLPKLGFEGEKKTQPFSLWFKLPESSEIMESFSVETFFVCITLDIVSGDDFMLTPSLHQSDLEGIIWPEESLCLLGLLLLHICYSDHKHFFPPSTILNLLTPNTRTVFNYISPHPSSTFPTPTWNTNAAARASLISRVFVK